MQDSNREIPPLTFISFLHLNKAQVPELWTDQESVIKLMLDYLNKEKKTPRFRIIIPSFRNTTLPVIFEKTEYWSAQTWQWRVLNSFGKRLFSFLPDVAWGRLSSSHIPWNFCSPWRKDSITTLKKSEWQERKQSMSKSREIKTVSETHCKTLAMHSVSQAQSEY